MFSIVMPMDTNRLEQFKGTKQVYDSFPQEHEFLIPTRSQDEVATYLKTHKLDRNVRLLPYKHDVGFNPSKALNMGVREAKFDHIIVTSPEVMPITDVLAQFAESIDKNIICLVYDQDESGDLSVLVSKTFRGDTPAMYFLAMYQRKDIEAINGWDEEFMKGYAFEDNDFGQRWVQARLPFEVREDILGVHQYHPRNETISDGWLINQQLFYDNKVNGVIKCANGLKSTKAQ